MKEIFTTITTTPKPPSQIQPQHCARILRSITIDTSNQYQYQWSKTKNQNLFYRHLHSPPPSSGMYPRCDGIASKVTSGLGGSSAGSVLVYPHRLGCFWLSPGSHCCYLRRLHRQDSYRQPQRDPNLPLPLPLPLPLFRQRDPDLHLPLLHQRHLQVHNRLQRDPATWGG